MTGHPDPDVLAEFREGLLARRRAKRIRAHLAGCTRCAAVDGQIAEVSSLLASAPAPRMPDQLARRLEAALAAESAARAARAHDPEAAQAAKAAAGRAPDGSPALEPSLADHDGRDHRDQPASRPDATARPGRAARRRRPAAPRVPALRAAAIAAAVVVIAGGGYGLARVLSGPAGHEMPAGSAGGQSTRQPALLPLATTPGSKSAAGAPGAQAAGLPLIRSGTDYQPGQLVAQVERELHRQPANNAAPVNLGMPPQNRGLAGCVSAITRGIHPRLVDQARYQGRPATIIVTSGAGGLAGQVWVAGSGCSASRPDVITHAQLSGTG